MAPNPTGAPEMLDSLSAVAWIALAVTLAALLGAAVHLLHARRSQPAQTTKSSELVSITTQRSQDADH